MSEWTIILHAASTLAMVGLIWFVQIVHYPLMGQIGKHEFSDYERRHQARTTLVVGPLMLTEAATAVLLLWLRPDFIASWLPMAGAALLVAIWASTALWQMPAHAKLESAYDAAVHRWLVQSNWLRTIAWSLRGVLACWMLGAAIQGFSP